MAEKKILTVQDISCVGQCSLTVALPILSACGLECCVLPTAMLSTHTAFRHFTNRDLTDEMAGVRKVWEKERIRFDALYTGYLGSARQVAEVKAIMESCLQPGAVRIVDPAMADNGRLYPAFDGAFVAAMRELCREADVILPNLTEACLLAEYPYPETYGENGIKDLLAALRAAVGERTVVLTGIGYRAGKTGVLVARDGETDYYEHERLARSCHGTGDVYASVFTGALMRGMTVPQAAWLAADFTVECIKNTVGNPAHWYGVNFEGMLPQLWKQLGEERNEYERDLRG